jgi:hypothetical protein
MLVLDLAHGEYILRRENVIALGPSGTGKATSQLAEELSLPIGEVNGLVFGLTAVALEGGGHTQIRRGCRLN